MRFFQLVLVMSLLVLCSFTLLQADRFGRTSTAVSVTGISGSVEHITFPFDSIAPVVAPEKGTSQSYPWLSSDGLRLYYTHGGEHSLYVASRESLSQSFGEGRLADLIQPGLISCWLTDDELTAWYVVREPVRDTGANGDIQLRSALYRAGRSNRDEEFSHHKRITLQAESLTGFISSASMTQDNEFLYLYNSRASHAKVILEFQRVSETVYRLNYELPLPYGMSAEPGQLSRNNLRYYTSLELIENGEPVLGYYERKSLLEPFQRFIAMKGTVGNDGYVGYQPTVSADESVLVFVKTADYSWVENRLHVAQRSNASVVDELRESSYEEEAIQSFFMNRDGILSVNFHIGTVDQERTLVLYNSNGKELMRHPILRGKAHARVNISMLPSGLYFGQVIVGSRHLSMKKFHVVR